MKGQNLTMKTTVSRRAVLAACGGVATTGCLGSGQSNEEAVILKAVEVRNLDDSAHTITGKIRRDGETILEKTVDVAPRSEGMESLAVLGQSFPDEKATYHVYCSLEESDEEVESKLSPVLGSECIKSEIYIRNERSLEVWMGENSRC